MSDRRKTYYTVLDPNWRSSGETEIVETEISVEIPGELIEQEIASREGISDLNMIIGIYDERREAEKRKTKVNSDRGRE